MLNTFLLPKEVMKSFLPRFFGGFFRGKILLLFAFFLITSCFAQAQMQFVAPMPGSKEHNPDRNIIIRPGGIIDAQSLRPFLFHITGSLSGDHEFNYTLALDGKTIVLNPVSSFAYGEKVTVSMDAGVRQTDERTVNAYSFSFYTHRKYTSDEEQHIVQFRQQTLQNEFGSSWQSERSMSNTSKYFTINVNTTPDSGAIFFSNWSFLGLSTQRWWIVKNNGDSIYSTVPVSNPFVWTLNHNSYVTAWTGGNYTMMDSNYVPIKDFSTTNGYPADVHEFLVFPDGHYYLIGDDNEFVDMRQYDSSYQSNALVQENVIQKFDKNNNLLFEWRTFDHIAVTEAIHDNLGGGQIDATHCNAIEEDPDGNILVSFREIDQIDKIDVNTGAFIWRFGGQKNEFKFTNDPAQINYQHDVRRLANGNMTVFDNNVWGIPNNAYAKEYQLDEVKKKAKLVWEYTHPAVNGVPMSSFAMGNVQRLYNGHTLISWGKIPFESGLPNATEVDSLGNIVWEMQYTPANYDIFYRALRYNWTPCSRPSDKLLSTTGIKPTSAKLNWNASTGAVKYNIEYRKKGTSNWTKVKVKSPKLSCALSGLTASTNYEWHIKTWCDKNGIKQSNFSSIVSFKTPAQKEVGLSESLIVNVYPNPVHDLIHVQWNENNANESQAEALLTDIAGRVLQSWTMPVSFGENDQALSFRDVPKGMYLLRIVTGDQQQLQKIVVE